MNIQSEVRQITIVAPATSQQLFEVYGVTGFLDAFRTLEEAINFRNQIIDQLVKFGG